MAGEMDFWDMAEYKVVGSLRAEVILLHYVQFRCIIL